MFEDIEQMEKEIEIFRNNMMASSDLVKGITELTEATKHQKASFASSSEKLAHKIDICIEQIKENNNDALQTFSNNNDVTVNSLQEKMAAEQRKCIAELDQIKTALMDMQEKYTEELHQTEETIRTYQAESKEKYNDCMQRLENVNMESLIKEVQDLKQTFQKKTLILTCGVAVTLIITILQLLGL